MGRPGISVVMPVYNGQETIEAAIRSLLGQDHDDFELVVVDDGSEDETVAIVTGFGDPRIRLFRHERNEGIVQALNVGVGVARGELIARLDADDLSSPQRLGRQTSMFKSYPALGLLGTAYGPSTSREDGAGSADIGPAAMRLLLHFGNRLAHSSVMFRRQLFDTLGGYRAEAWPAEDYDFWIRMSESTEVRSIPESLTILGDSPGGISARNWNLQRAMACGIATSSLERLLGEEVPLTVVRGLMDAKLRGARDVAMADHLIVAAERAVRRECVSRGMSRAGLARASAYLLHQMRYRTVDGARHRGSMLTLPVRSPRVAAALAEKRSRWILARAGGSARRLLR